jgi:hypothetical protein
MELKSIKPHEPENKGIRRSILSFIVLIVIELIEQFISDIEFLDLLISGLEVDLLPFDIAFSNELYLIKINIQRSVRLIEIIRKILNLDDIDISHQIQRFQIHSVERIEYVNHIFMDVFFLGLDDSLEIAGSIEMKAERTKSDSIVAHIVDVIEIQKNKQTFLLKNIVFSFFFIH